MVRLLKEQETEEEGEVEEVVLELNMVSQVEEQLVVEVRELKQSQH